MSVNTVGGNAFNSPLHNKTISVAKEPSGGTKATNERNMENSGKNPKDIAPKNVQNNANGNPAKGTNVNLRA